MAEKTQERKTFKYGDQDYLVDDAASKLREYIPSFLNFARDKGLFDQAALQTLSTAIEDRLTAIKEGKQFNADGSLDGTHAQNVTMTIKRPKKHGLSKDDKELTQGIRDWVDYFVNKSMLQLKPFQGGTSDKGAWDVTKHGLSAYLTGQGLNAKEIFENYDTRDKDNPDNPRTFNQRLDLLKQHLTGYQTWLQGRGFDFTKNSNDWDDSFMSDLQDLVNNFDTYSKDTNSITSRLRKLGAGDAYTTAFTSDKWDLSQSDQSEAQLKAEQEKKKKEQEANAFKAYASGLYNGFAGLADNNLGGTTYFKTSGDGLFDMSDSEWEDFLNTHTNDRDAYVSNLKQKYLANPFDVQAAGAYLPILGRAGRLKEVTIDGKQYKYDPETIDRTKNRFVAFDPITGEIRHAFIGDLQDEWNQIKRRWQIDQGYLDPASQYTAYENGGVISMQTGGGFDIVQYVNSELEKRNKARAEANGKTEEQQEAADRIVGSKDDATIASPDAGFTATDTARLASIAMDIGSIFLTPIAGVATGLASSITNFGADWAEDGLDWGDVKNLGINVGFDLLGAIPVFGDAVGTGSKITKNLIKWAPRVMTGLAAFQGVKNFDGMMESWGKLTTKGEKMTVQDWRNIQQSIGLVTGTTRAIRNKAAQNRAKQAARIDDVVGVNVYNKQTQKVEQILVDGDVAKNIRAAKGDKAKIEAELSKLDDLKGKFGEAGDFEVATQRGEWQNPWQKVEGADGKTSREWMGFRKDGRAQVSDVYDFSRIQSGHFKGIDQSPTTKIDHRGKLTGEQIDAQYNKLLEDAGVEAMVKRVNTDVEARNNAIASAKQKHQQIKRDLDAAQANLRGQKSEADLLAAKAAAQAELGRLPNNQALIKSENALAHHQAIIDGGIAKQQALVAARDKNLANIESGHQKKLSDKEAELNDLKETLRAAKARLKSAGKTKSGTHPKLEAAIKQADAAVKKARAEYNKLKKDTPKIIAVEQAKGTQQFQTKNSKLQSEIQKAKNEVKKLQGVAAQRASYREHRAKLDEARKGLNMRAKTEADIRKLQQRLNHAAGINSQVSPSHHTRAYLELQNKIASLQSANPTIGGRAITWDMDAILQKYGFAQPKAYKSGGTINRNKINKFINYAKG